MNIENGENNRIKSIINFKFYSGIFFAIFSLLFLLFAKYTLLSLKNSLLLPFFSSSVVAIIIGWCMGRLFGNLLAKNKHWIWSFCIGSLMAILAILLISLVVLIYAYYYDATFLNSVVSRIHYWQDYFIVYGLMVISVILTIGAWLIPLTGVAAIYFNKHFLPGLIKSIF